MMQTSKTGNKHDGKQIKRFRESIGMKQDILAKELGTTQQNISHYEKQEDLDDEIFAQLAKGMGVNPEVLKDFSTDASIFTIQEMKDSSQAIYNFNPLEKILEQSQKIEDLYQELLATERDKIEMLKNTNSALQKIMENFANTGGNTGKL